MTSPADPALDRVGRVERSDPAAAADLGWCERFDFEAHSPQATFGLHVTVVRWPAAGRTWYWSGIVEAGRPLVSIVELDAGSGRPTLELRTGGLWADHNVETPLTHWSVGLEAFAVGLDDPTEVFGAFRGDRVPVGYDLEWESEPDEVVPALVDDGYGQPAVAHGEVLLGPSTTYELDGLGMRWHTWGTSWPAPGVRWAGRAADGTVRAVGTALEEAGPVEGLGAMDGNAGVSWPAGALPVVDATPWGPVAIVGWSPARLTTPDGRIVDVARGLWQGRDGDAGAAGWVEVVAPADRRGR